MKAVGVIVAVLGLFLFPALSRAEHKSAVAGQVVDSNDSSISIGTECNGQAHYHGTLNGAADPDPHGCGHGVVTKIAHGDGDGETLPAAAPSNQPSAWSKFWGWVGSFFSDKTKETAKDVIDVAAEANGIPPPGTVSDTVDIVKDAAPSIKANADNAEKYFDTYEDAPDRDRYTLEGENPEQNAPSPSLYRWFWSIFE